MKRLKFTSSIRYEALSLAVLLSCGVVTNAAFDPQALIRANLRWGDTNLELIHKRLNPKKVRTLAPI